VLSDFFERGEIIIGQVQAHAREQSPAGNADGRIFFWTAGWPSLLGSSTRQEEVLLHQRIRLEACLSSHVLTLTRLRDA